MGIIAGIIDQMGLVDTVNELVGTHAQEQVSTGQVLKAMILNGLGYLKGCDCVWPVYGNVILNSDPLLLLSSIVPLS